MSDSMKKSKQVPAVLVAAVAAYLVAGCSSGPTDVRRCVDATGKVVPDINCENGSGSGTFVGGNGYSGSGGYSGSYYHSSHWVYGGSYSPSTGTVSGYHSTPSAGADVTDSAGHSISRGGFGGRGGSGG